MSQLNRNPSLNEQIDATFKNYNGSIQTRFTDFLSNAWNKTFLPHKPSHEHHLYHVGHSFFGFPKTGGKKGLFFYFASLGFIRTPLVNTIKLLTEFPLKALAESMDYLRHRLMSLSPTSTAGQYFRSFLLLATTLFTGLFEGIRFIVRTITSPITSAKKAFKKHAVLGVLSIIASSVFLFGILAGVLVATGGVASIPILGGIVASIPAVAANLASAGILAGFATVATAIVAGVNEIIKKTFYADKTKQYPSESKNSDILSFESDDEWNVVDFGKSSHKKSISPTSMSDTLRDSQKLPSGSEHFTTQKRAKKYSVEDEDFTLVF